MNEEWTIERIGKLLGEYNEWPRFLVDDGEANLYLDGEQSRYSIVDEKGFVHAWVPSERTAHLFVDAREALAWCADAIETAYSLANSYATTNKAQRERINELLVQLTNRNQLVRGAVLRESQALYALSEFGQVDGAHHKAYAIDQAVRALLGDKYDSWIASMAATGLTWDVGIAP